MTLKFIVRAIITALHGCMILTLVAVLILSFKDRTYISMLLPVTGLVLVTRFAWKGIILWP